MNPIERIYKIDHLLRSRKVVTSRSFCDELEVSNSTLKRDIEYMKARLYAPIEWDPVRHGYVFVEQKGPGPRYQLPGLWFNASEAHALLTMQNLLAKIEPGLLEPQVRPLQNRLRAILGGSDHSADEVQRRIRILDMGSRRRHLKHFETVASAVLNRKQIHIQYRVRSRNELTERGVSPQRLVHYRDNWYLDGWCHLRKDIRSFAVDAIEKVTILATTARNVSDNDLDAVLASGYGIFSGTATLIASLRFTALRARWVSLESWHPEQIGRIEEDGTYTLEFPYSDDRELVGDILRFGSEILVLNPPSLRERVAEQLRLGAAQYQ